MTGSDSAGTPWSGRTLSGTGFDADTGSADAAVLEALADAHAQPSADADARLVRAAATARWLVPVVAVLDEAEQGNHGHTVEKRTDMAVITLTAPDGRRALPIFTSTAALAAWDPTARPVPVSAARAAQAAVAEGCHVAVVDLGSAAPTELRPSMVWALAQEAEWHPAHTDPFVAQAVSRAVADEADVVEHRLEEGEPLGRGVLRIVLGLPAGLSAASVEALATRVGEQLATDGELRARVDELTFAVEAVKR
ncbi:MAG TPA: SseB family protein [Lapillicoccus sp.]|nr:SseB family protein [Lapillicoccus sp.]